jgi:hypothetical protein
LGSFRYTGDGRVFRPSLLMMAVLSIVEVPVLGFLLHVIVPGPVGVALESLLAAVTLALLVLLATPLFTRHRIEHGVLRVRYGLLVAADVPLDEVVAVRPVRMPVGFLQPLGAIVNGSKAQVAFSETGQVEIELRRPCRLRTGWSRASIDRLVINADEPDELMLALRSGHV